MEDAESEASSDASSEDGSSDDDSLEDVLSEVGSPEVISPEVSCPEVTNTPEEILTYVNMPAEEYNGIQCNLTANQIIMFSCLRKLEKDKVS